MCGIAGALGIRDGGTLVERMTATLRHRGPDGTGHCSRESRHVGATRLSIIDLGGGSQPVYNETGTACVVFNGEIYNHHQLRAELRTKGHTFRTATDTEVIIHLYEEMGDACVRRLEGMFAFAVLDGERVLLARDRLGIKPLYFALVRGAQLFLFASEIKALFACPDLTPRLNLQALADSITLSHATGDDTFFEGVKSLRPGHTMVVSCGERLSVGAPIPYYTYAPTHDALFDLDEAQSRLDAALSRAVETHLAADVEVGLTLSGGIDSSVLACLAAEQRERPLLTFAVADHDEHPDVVQARQVAKTIGATHQTVIMTFDDYLDAIPGLIAGEEQPSSLSGAAFYFLCRVIAERAKVVLHGEGADELFGGYTPYLDRDSRPSYIRERLPILKHLGVAPSDQAIETIKRLASPQSFDEYLREIFDINMGAPLERQHLVPVDKCAMAASVEIRVPYLDDKMVELLGSMPLQFLVRPDLGVRKYLLRRLALSRFGVGMMDVVLRQKYGAPAACVVLLDRFDALCNETLPDEYVTRHEFGRCFTSKRELILFDMFIEVFMTHRGDAAAMGGVVDFMRSRAQRPQVPGRRTRVPVAADPIEDVMSPS